MDIVAAALYVGRGVISSPMAREENSGEAGRDSIFDRTIRVEVLAPDFGV